MARVTSNSASGPVRTCVGCRRRAAKSELLRVVAGEVSEGLRAVVPDPTATAPGRGAHLHPTVECHELAVRRRAFTRALRVRENLSAASLVEYVATHTGSTTARTTSTQGSTDDSVDRHLINRPETGAGSS